MLQFNPYNRPTAKELLKHKMFDEIRNDDCEHSASYRINIDIDNDIDEPEDKLNVKEFASKVKSKLAMQLLKLHGKKNLKYI